jgi:hypothetical protein
VCSTIRIVVVPPGQAPLWVRKSWVGLELPAFRNRPYKRHTVGVLDRPKSAQFLWDVICGRVQATNGYMVETIRAVEILDTANAAAATWWRQNTPHLLRPKRYLLFPVEVCQFVDPEDSVINR